MLSFKRQACYWAISLAAVLVSRTLNTYPAPSQSDSHSAVVWIFVLGIYIAAALQDAHHRNEEIKAARGCSDLCRPKYLDLWDPSKHIKYTYYAVLAPSLVCLGYATGFIRGLFSYTTECNATAPLLGPEPERLHAVVAYILLAEAEYWRHSMPSTYNYKTAFSMEAFEGRKECPHCHPTVIVLPVLAVGAATWYIIGFYVPAEPRYVFEIELSGILASPVFALWWPCHQWLKRIMRRRAQEKVFNYSSEIYV